MCWKLRLLYKLHFYELILIFYRLSNESHNFSKLSIFIFKAEITSSQFLEVLLKLTMSLFFFSIISSTSKVAFKGPDGYYSIFFFLYTYKKITLRKPGLFIYNKLDTIENKNLIKDNPLP